MVGDSTDGQCLTVRLRADGYLVDSTRSRLEALNLARDRKYTVYVVDIPDADGTEIIGEIRKVQPEASVIVAARGPGMQADEFTLMASKILSDSDGGPGMLSLEAMEKRLISTILAHVHGNIRQSANILDIDRSTLYEKIKKYGITRTKERSRKDTE